MEIAIYFNKTLNMHNVEFERFFGITLKAMWLRILKKVRDGQEIEKERLF